MDYNGIDTALNVAQSIQNLGAGIIALAIILVLFFVVVTGTFVFLRATIKKQNEQHDMILQEQITQVRAMFNNLLENQQPETSNVDILKTSMQIADSAEEQLKYTCAVTKSDRTAIYMFHNGVKTLNGSHILKFSCLVEYATLSKYYENQLYKDTPINQIREACNLFTEDKLVCYWNTGNLENDSAIKEWMERRGVKGAVAAAVHDSQGRVIGFVATEYYMGYPDPSMYERIQEETHELALKVAMAMDLELLKCKQSNRAI